MRFLETDVADAWVIELEPIGDERGSFARAFSAEEFADRGIPPDVVQANVSVNVRAGTLRGFHLQRAPHGETKTVRCTRGSLFDVVADLRPDSPTYLRWFGIELSADNGRALVVPEGCGHAFQTLEDDTRAYYQVSAAYAPQAEAGVRYDDPALGVEWPLPVTTLSDKDANWPPLAAGQVP